MKAKKKPTRIKQKIREEKKRRQHIVFAIAILIAVISVSGFVVNSMLNQATNPAYHFKAAIVDQLSLTFPNQTFIEKATNTLKQAGYTVDYYPGEQVTVEFYRNLPTHGYGLIIFRVHAAINPYGKYTTLFTSESYSQTKYVGEQLDDRFGIVQFLPYNEGDPKYFGIPPRFIAYSMNGRFQKTIIIVMGCNGLTYTSTAEAFIEKGASVYVSWNGSISGTLNDLAITCLLQRLIPEKQTIKEAVADAMREFGPSLTDSSVLQYYPLEAGEQSIDNIVGN